MTDSVFTSGLSASESLLLQDAGFEPAGLVMGSSVLNLGPKLMARSVAQLTGPSFGTMFAVVQGDGGEVVILSRAMSTARKKAMERLEDDAREVRADGVIDIRVETKWDSWYDGALEFMMTGTAVRRIRPRETDDLDPGPEREGDGRLFTCDLSGQDFWSLRRSGFQVLGFVMGYCAYAAGPEHAVTVRELRAPTKAVYAARELAISRMRTQAGHLRATGIVGVRLDGLDGFGSLSDRRTLEFRATGTAIAAGGDPPGLAPPVPVTGL